MYFSFSEIDDRFVALPLALALALALLRLFEYFLYSNLLKAGTCECFYIPAAESIDNVGVVRVARCRARREARGEPPLARAAQRRRGAQAPTEGQAQQLASGDRWYGSGGSCV